MKFLLLVFSVVFTLFSSVAQTSENITVEKCFKNEQNEIVISLKNTDSFIVGANRYVLHIGEYHFLRNIHPDGRLDQIQFILTKSEFETLKNGSEIVLVYGLYHENTQQDGEAQQANGFTGLHWKLGKFDQTQLK